VLDGGVFLTAAEIAMLDPIPELVFLNCCYLGQMGRPTAYHKMAASISRELIRKGVRAVVAAGWPVRDDDALVFARVFYESLLGNDTFGNAIKKAREETWNRQSSSNTWGAYQAYGDPDFRLDPRSDGSGGEAAEFMVAAQELLDKLDGMTERAKKSGGKAAAVKQVDELRKLRKNCAPEWLEQGVVQARFAKLYGELGHVDESMDCFKQAVESDDPDTPATLRTVEQWANQEARLAEQAINMTKEQRIGMITSSIARLKHLVEIGTTSERLSLLGSAYKRWAQIESDPNTIRQHLRQSADYYRRAASPKQDRTVVDPYPVVNWLAIQMILGEHVPDDVMWLEKCEVAARQRFEKAPNLWDAVTLVDVALLRHVRQGTVEKNKEALVSRYREAIAEVGATPKDIDSVLNQLKFVIDTLDKLGKGTDEKKPKPAWLQALEYIRMHLQQDEPSQKANESAEAPKARAAPSHNAPRRVTRGKRVKAAKSAPTAKKK
jgi:tetratricopeptide (TPR) repeat protein